MKAYRERKKAAQKLWQYQTNTAAWLQGQYIAAAIGACLSKDNHYPTQPLDVFKDGSESGEESSAKVESSDDAIRAQSKRVDRILAVRNQPPEETVGEKRD